MGRFNHSSSNAGAKRHGRRRGLAAGIAAGAALGAHQAYKKYNAGQKAKQTEEGAAKDEQQPEADQH